MPVHDREERKRGLAPCPVRRLSKPSNGLYFLIAGCVLLFDQATKAIVLAKVGVAQTIPVIEHMFHITLVINRGVAFGLFANQPFIPKVVSLIAIAAITVFFLRFSGSTGLLKKLGLSLILGGCFGNTIDRFRFGVVVDFLDFRVWPVFNIADSAITIGVTLVFLGVIARQKRHI